MKMKKCNQCKKNKELLDFCKDKYRPDGLCSSCKICRQAYKKENREISRKQNKELYLKNKDTRLSQIKEWKSKNKDKVSQDGKEYYQKNKRRTYERVKDRRVNDIQCKITYHLRNRFHMAIKDNQKSGSAVRDLGCSIKDLKIHLEEQFQEGMTWDNHGLFGWHIDHRKPLASFDLTNREELLEACHFSNLQPLWAKDNLSKGCKILGELL